MLATRKFDEFLRFTGVKIPRYPLGLLAFNAQLIELIASALKNEQPMPELFEIGKKFFLDWKSFRRE